MIILPTLANMPMFADDKRLEMFKDGIMIGVFAPTLRQAQITFSRIRDRISSKYSKAILEEFNITFSTSNGQNVMLSNGSFVSAVSASDGSQIEGDSYHLIILDECLLKGTKISTPDGEKNIEDIKVGEYVYTFNHDKNKLEVKKVTKAFSQPLYGRKIVTIKTKNGNVLKCTDNHPIFVKGRGYIRADKVKVDDIVIVKSEGKIYVQGKRDTRFTNWDFIGRWLSSLSRQKVFQVSKILCKSLFSTTELFDKQVRSFKRLLQLCTQNRSKSRYGKSHNKVCHKMYSRTNLLQRLSLQRWKEENYPRFIRTIKRNKFSLYVSRQWEYIKSQWGNEVIYPYFSFRRPLFISRLFKRQLSNKFYNNGRQESKEVLFPFSCRGQKQVHEDCKTLYTRGITVQDTNNTTTKIMCGLQQRIYTLLKKTNNLWRRLQKDTQVRVRQKEKYIKETEIEAIKISEPLDFEVYDLTVEYNHNFFAENILVHNCQDISTFKIQKSILPMASAYNGTIVKIGTPSTFKGDFYYSISNNKKYMREHPNMFNFLKNHYEYDYKIGCKYNPKYAKYIEQMKKSVGENSDAFRMSYKLEWIIERGMFVNIELFEKNNLERGLDRIVFDKTNTYVAGLDIGGVGEDSTVISIVQVDWEMPVIMEQRIDDDTNETYTYLAYNCYLVDWLRLRDMNNYEEQYPIIIEYLKKFNVVKLVADSTRERSLIDRINANVDFEVIYYTFTQKAKSELYKYYERELSVGRARVCGSQEAQSTEEYKQYIKELSEVQKGYSGIYMTVSHNSSRGATDDFVDSHALAVWGCMSAGEVDKTESFMNKFRQKTKYEQSIFKQAKRNTARRR